MAFVGPELREEQVPCRFVRLTPDGLTVDSLYQHATLQESEEALRNWLRREIADLETKLHAARPPQAPS